MIIIKESLNTDNVFSDYVRMEVIDSNGEVVGGLFRGLKQLLDDLWESDDPMYDDLNEPLSRLEYITPYPDGLDSKGAKFAYTKEFYQDNIEEFKDIEYVLLELGWDIVTKEINDVNEILYEDDIQIAYR